MSGDIAFWDDKNIWRTEGDVTIKLLTKEDICSPDGPSGGHLMILPPNLNWPDGRDLCRRLVLAFDKSLTKWAIII